MVNHSRTNFYFLKPKKDPKSKNIGYEVCNTFVSLHIVEVFWFESDIGILIFAGPFNKSKEENEYGGRTNVRSSSAISSKLSCGTIYRNGTEKTT